MKAKALLLTPRTLPGSKKRLLPRSRPLQHHLSAKAWKSTAKGKYPNERALNRPRKKRKDRENI